MKPDVQTIRDVIYYRSAELIACSMFKIADVEGGGGDRYGYVHQIYHDLKTGRWQWSTALGVEFDPLPERRCAFCGAETPDLAMEYVIPAELAVNEHCRECENLRGEHNVVWCCPSCRASKQGRGLYASFGRKPLNPRQPRAVIPAPVEKSYLRAIYNCHQCAGTLDSGDLDGDGNLTLFDVDVLPTRRSK